MSEREIRSVRDRRDAPLLARFYDEVYLPAFAHQREPLAAWTAQLWGDAAAYDLAIVVAGDHLDDPSRARIDGGVISELYPASACGLLTYLVVAPHARHGGLGRALLDGARRSLAERAAARGLALAAVFGEVSDPARYHGDARADAVDRIARFVRWGARVVDHPYVQPRLALELARDPALRLIAFFDGAPPATLPGPLLADFLREFFAVTEGAPLSADPALAGLVAAIPAEVPLVS